MKFLKRKNVKNLMLIDIRYHRASKNTEYHDYLDIIYKDLGSNEIILETIEDPEIEIYFVKEEFRDYNYNKEVIDIDKCYTKLVKYKNIEMEIAYELGPEYINEIKSLRSQRRFYECKNIHKCPYVFGSDLNIVDWYRIQWMFEYENDSTKIPTKAYLDIEIDAIDIPEGYGESGECPINAVTIVSDDTNSSYTFLLRNENNPQIDYFEDNIEKFTKECHDDFDESYGKLDYSIYMYDSEVELIKDIFRLLNTLKPNFCMIWNMPFDIPYIINRLNVLGVDPVDVMTSKDFKIRELYFKKDTRNFKIENKADNFECSSYTRFLDQMVLYAALRKGKELRENNLSYTAKIELGDDKLDYSTETDMKHFAYHDYWKFVKYNIKDVLLQLGIERKTNDIDNIYIRAQSNFTNYEKVFKQTIFINNRAYYEYMLELGVIKGNNPNIFYGDDYNDTSHMLDINIDEDDEEDETKDSEDKKFAGALVANPELNENVGTKLLGMLSKYIFDNVIDEDFSSMYPWIIIVMNLCKMSMIGKVIVLYIPPEKQKEKKYDTGQDFIDDVLTDNVLQIGTKWLDLPTVDEVMNELDEEFL